MGRPADARPWNAWVLLMGVLTVLTLAALKPAFDAYYAGMLDRTVERHLATYDDLAVLEAANARAEAALGGGRLPIDRAMEQLATRGRLAFPAISPRPGAEQNLAALRGWGQMPQELPDLRAPEPEPMPIPGDAISPEALRGIEGALRDILERRSAVPTDQEDRPGEEAP